MSGESAAFIRRWCSGCTEDFYNGHNDLGVKRCWGLESGEVIWRKRVSVSQRPPWNQPARRFMSCRHEKGYVFVGPKQTN